MIQTLSTLLIDIYKENAEIEEYKNAYDIWDAIDSAMAAYKKIVIFSLNDEILRKKLLNSFKPFCDYYGIHVECDSFNNPPYVIDQNLFVVDFYFRNVIRRYTLKDMEFVCDTKVIEFD